MRTTTEISGAIHRVAAVENELESMRFRYGLWVNAAADKELDPGQRAYARGVRDELGKVIQELEAAIA